MAFLKMQESSQNIKILTVQEVAEILRVHRSTISRYAMSGELKSYMIGNRRLFKECDVWVFFENQSEKGCVLRKDV
jgi:excisionase family DNA binding protein